MQSRGPTLHSAVRSRVLWYSVGLTARGATARKGFNRDLSRFVAVLR